MTQEKAEIRSAIQALEAALELVPPVTRSTNFGPYAGPWVNSAKEGIGSALFRLQTALSLLPTLGAE